MSVWRQARESRWTAVFLAVLCAAAAVEAALLLRLDRARDLAGRQERQTAEIKRLAAQLEALRRSAGPQGPAQGAEALSAALADRLARERGLALLSNSESSGPAEGGLKETTVSASIQAVSREKLSGWLLAVESAARGARTRELRISANAASPRLVDARVVFVAYEREKSDAAKTP